MYFAKHPTGAVSIFLALVDNMAANRYAIPLSTLSTNVCHMDVLFISGKILMLLILFIVWFLYPHHSICWMIFSISLSLSPGVLTE